MRDMRTTATSSAASAENMPSGEQPNQSPSEKNGDAERSSSTTSRKETSSNGSVASGEHCEGFRSWLWNLLNSNLILSLATLAIFYLGYQTNVTTKHAVNDARKHARVELSAYVSAVEGKVIGLRDRGPMRVRITVRNTGKTPAYETKIESEAYWEGDLIPMAAPITEGETATLAPGEEFQFFHPKEFNASYRQKLRDGKLVLHVKGHVKWKDVFDEDQQYQFHYVQGGKYDPNSSLMGVVTAKSE